MTTRREVWGFRWVFIAVCEYRNKTKDFEKKRTDMPGRCVVQGSNNKSNPKEGISIHISPSGKMLSAKWKKFVLLYRTNFEPGDRFAICSNHFEDSCFSRLLHQEGAPRRLNPGSVPSIWKKRSTKDRFE